MGEYVFSHNTRYPRLSIIEFHDFLSQTGYFAVGLNYRSSESSKSRVRLEGTFCALILLLYSLHDIPRRG
jgi:hypothetical protein